MRTRDHTHSADDVSVMLCALEWYALRADLLRDSYWSARARRARALIRVIEGGFETVTRDTEGEPT